MKWEELLLKTLVDKTETSVRLKSKEAAVQVSKQDLKESSQTRHA